MAGVDHIKKGIRSTIRQTIMDQKQNLANSAKFNISANGGTQVVTTDPTQVNSTGTQVTDPSGQTPGATGLTGTAADDLNPQHRRGNSWEKDFGAPQGERQGTRTLEDGTTEDVTIAPQSGSNPWQQRKDAIKGRKIKKQNAIDAFKKRKQEIKNKPDAGPMGLTGMSKEQKKLEMKKARLIKRRDKSPMNYLNPNTLGVEGDAGQDQQVEQENAPNRAGRAINSNILMNDPMNYQDPSKISASQNSTEQMFSGLASSMGNTNPEPMIPGQDPNQSITPGQPSPFNKNGDPMKKMPTEKAITGKIPKSGTSEFRDMEEGAGTQDELNRMGKHRRQDIDRKDPWSQPSQTKLLQNEIKRNSGFADFKATDTMEKRYSGRKVPNSPLNKSGWIQEATADIKRRGTEGVCTGDKFGSESCPPGSKRYNLAKTFKKMAKKNKK